MDFTIYLMNFVSMSTYILYVGIIYKNFSIFINSFTKIYKNSHIMCEYIFKPIIYRTVTTSSFDFLKKCLSDGTASSAGYPIGNKATIL